MMKPSQPAAVSSTKAARDGSARAAAMRKASNQKLPEMTGTGFMARFMNAGLVDADRVAAVFLMTKTQLAQTIGLATASVSKAERRAAPKSQARMTEMLEIISRVRDWAGGETQAMAWYRSQPIPALDGRTPEALVKSGHAHAVRAYLDHLALGGFA